jgi:hypothetical protein
MSPRRYLPEIAAVLALVASHGAGQCIVYGHDWAAIFGPQPGWTQECRGGDPDLPDVLLYPSRTGVAQAPAVIYVRSWGGEDAAQPLEQFLLREISQYRKEYLNNHPGVKLTVATLPPLVTGDGRKALVRKITGTQGFNPEAAAYVDGLNVKLVVVVSGRDEATLEDAYGTFRKVVHDIRFMTAKVEATP